jgi:hypothetical protein
MDLTKIEIEVIPHDQHRYTTCGDWLYKEDGTLLIRISKLSDWRREMLVAVHELVEVLTCKNDGVPQDVVDQFDIAFEEKREEGNDDEPGDEPTAPYHRQHCLATGVERTLAAAWDVNWKDYDKELCDLPEIPNTGYIKP